MRGNIGINLRLALLGAALAVGVGGQEPADLRGHGLLRDAYACLTCHPTEGQGRWIAHRWRPCSPFCLGCHAPAAMAQHHTVGVPLNHTPSSAMALGAGQRLVCSTCHDLSKAREDQVPWKAESLYDRLFRKQRSYKTYFLVQRNERGQLCRVCH